MFNIRGIPIYKLQKSGFLYGPLEAMASVYQKKPAIDFNIFNYLKELIILRWIGVVFAPALATSIYVVMTWKGLHEQAVYSILGCIALLCLLLYNEFCSDSRTAKRFVRLVRQLDTCLQTCGAHVGLTCLRGGGTGIETEFVIKKHLQNLAYVAYSLRKQGRGKSDVCREEDDKFKELYDVTYELGFDMGLQRDYFTEAAKQANEEQQKRETRYALAVSSGDQV